MIVVCDKLEISEIKSRRPLPTPRPSPSPKPLSTFDFSRTICHFIQLTRVASAGDEVLSTPARTDRTNRIDILCIDIGAHGI